MAKVMIVSSTINPGNHDYHKATFETRNRFFFSTSFAMDVEGYIEESVVNTDQGYITSSDIMSERFLSVEDFFQARPMRVINDTYLTLRLQKSPVHRVFDRHFNKLDSFMAYVGGIVGTFVALIVVMRMYAEQAFSVSLASQLYTTEDDENISSTWFHIGYLFLIPFRRLINYIGCWKDSWPRTDFYQKCINEVNEQIDIVNIMRKLIFMEKAFSLLFNEHQLAALHLFKREKVDDATKARKKYGLENKIKTTKFKENIEVKSEDLESNSQQSEKPFKMNEVVPQNLDI